MKREVRRKWAGFLFVLPGLLSYLIWTLYPIIKSFLMSLYKWNINPRIPNEFVGLSNYVKLFHDDKFYTALINTLKYVIVTVPGQMIIGLLIAVLLTRGLKGQTFFRLLYYLPVITSWVVVSVLFQYLFATRGGLVNYLLKDLLHLINRDIRWLAQENTAMIPIYVLGIWKGIGWSMLIFLAGLQGIPKQLYEAARIDGANGWMLLRKITIPMLRPVIAFQTVMLTIGGFNVFLSVYVITGGGPRNSTQVLSSYMFKEAFDYFHFGYGAAIAVIFFLIVFTIAQIQRKLFKREIY
ncbi:MAG: sugar ABC transporter permease [Thermotogae bacterium]|uniref:carbohydrate ABC transporter permease n=1 Tax=Kosmotoga sp. TaxID=1955248 RepID=UPI000F238194|nr:sugar ABC transporter permease [Kosmotoga sp.]MCD6160166.1 sugar ABC transporter permease [Kosmotoga sp.]RKX49995.1 MAG: sugar ABC transporter permease [Thermotogota bacterium]